MTIDQEQLQRAIALIKKGSANADYFFEQLKSPDWIEPLANQGLFSKPYAAVRRDNAVWFPFWAPGQYLARMAKIPEAQLDVLEILRGLPASDNPRVYEVVADAAAALPAKLAKDLVPQLERGLELPFHTLLPEKVGAVIMQFAEADLKKETLRLFETLLAISPAPEPRSEDAEASSLIGRKATARIDDWQYARVLNQILPPVVATTGRRAVHLLSDMLEQAIAAERSESSRVQEDYSYIWRPSIEHDDERHDGIKNALVTAVKDSVDQIVSTSANDLRALVDELLGRPGRIFHRIALWVLLKHGELDVDLVQRVLSEPTQWEEIGLHPEFELLVAKFFGRLSADVQKQYLSWIDRGPDLDRYVGFRKGMDGQAPPDSDVQQHRDIWKRDHLSVIAQGLPENWKERLGELTTHLGPAPEAGRALYSVSAGFRGEKSFLTESETLSIDWPSLIARLGSWSPRPGDFEGPSIEGTAGSLRQRVKANPAEAIQNLVAVEDVRPQYVSAIVETLRDVIKEKQAVEWDPLLAFLGKVVDTAQTSDDPDHGWRWVSKCVASLIGDSFEAGAGSIPIRLRETVWRIVERLAQNDDPTPEHEERYGGSNMDPATLSLNTVRGESFHAIIRYALWCHRHLASLPQASELIKRGFEEMPEVRTLLDRHLDLGIEPSLAVRAVYGQWFPWLVLLDKAWATERVDAIFSSSADHSEHFWAAWGTYVVFAPPYTNVLPILRAVYLRAIGELGQGMSLKVGMGERPSEHLADHLVAYYWRGEIGLAETDLLFQFFAAASAKLRGHAMESAGRALHQLVDELSPEIQKRLTDLWDWRMEQTQAAPEELGAFGWWFGSGRLDQDWSLSTLEKLLSLSIFPEPDHFVMERLAAIADLHPMAAVVSLDRMIDLAPEPWTIHGWIEQARSILEKGIGVGGEVKERAERVVHRLGALRFREFRTLLSRPEQGSSSKTST